MWTGFEGFDQRGRKVVDNYFLKSELGTLRQKRKRNNLKKNWLLLSQPFKQKYVRLADSNIVTIWQKPGLISPGADVINK